MLPAGASKRLVLLHRLFQTVFEQCVVLLFASILIDLLLVIGFLLVQLVVELNRFRFKPLDPLAQIRDSAVIHQTNICLVLLNLEELELFAHFLHLAFVSFLEVVLVRLQLLLVVCVDVLSQ